ncbi:MAG: DUF4129 domain-containing protein [Nitriliruptoraceae bacterium]
MMFVLLASAFAGPWEFESRDFGFSLADRFDQLPELDLNIADDDLDELPPQRDWDLRWLDIVARVIVAIVAALVLWRILRRITFSGKARRRSASSPGGMLVDGADPRLPEMQQGLETALSRLDEIADPGDAVIAAWIALEEAAAASGVARAPSQTPTEFTMSILERLDADPVAAATLLRLYHRVRFAHRRPTDGDVIAARASLIRLAEYWDASHVAKIGTNGVTTGEGRR